MWELLNGGFIRVWQDGVVGNRNRNEMVDEWYIWLVELNTQLKDDASFYAIAYEELKGRDIALVNPGFDEHTGWGWYGLNSSQSKETWKGFPLHSSVKPDSNFYMTHSMLSLLWWFSYFLASFLTEVWKYFKYLCSYICTGYEVTAHHRHHTNSYVIHLCVSQPTHKSECE